MQSIYNYVEWPRFSKIQVYAFEKFEKDLSPTHCCKVFLLITHCLTTLKEYIWDKMNINANMLSPKSLYIP